MASNSITIIIVAIIVVLFKKVFYLMLEEPLKMR